MTTPTTPLDLDAITARAEAATEGPWEACGYDVETVPEFDLHRFDIIPDTIASAELTKTDAEFIAHARTDVPALVEEVKEMRKRFATRAEWSRISADWTRMCADRDAAIARAEAAEGEARGASDEVHHLNSVYGGETRDRIDTAMRRAKSAERERDEALAKVEQLRGLCAFNDTTFRQTNTNLERALHRRDVAEAKVAAGLVLADERDAFEWQSPCESDYDKGYARGYENGLKRVAADLRAALTEVQAGAGASGTGELCPTCGRTRTDRTARAHNEGFGLCPESFHFRTDPTDSTVQA